MVQPVPGKPEVKGPIGAHELPFVASVPVVLFRGLQQPCEGFLELCVEKLVDGILKTLPDELVDVMGGSLDELGNQFLSVGKNDFLDLVW